MSLMTGFEPETAPEEAPGRKLGSIDEDQFLTGSLLTSETIKRTRWQRFGTRASFILHGVAIALLIFVPIFTPPDLPGRDIVTVLLYDPPPPPPPPLPKGSKNRPEPLEPETPKLVVEDPPEETDFTAPIETPTPTAPPPPRATEAATTPATIRAWFSAFSVTSFT
jgi:hypothetical protein